MLAILLNFVVDILTLTMWCGITISVYVTHCMRSCVVTLFFHLIEHFFATLLLCHCVIMVQFFI